MCNFLTFVIISLAPLRVATIVTLYVSIDTVIKSIAIVIGVERVNRNIQVACFYSAMGSVL